MKKLHILFVILFGITASFAQDVNPNYDVELAKKLNADDTE